MKEREETFEALHALVALADRAETHGWSKLAAALRATSGAVEDRLRKPELSIVVAGSPRAKRMLFNGLAARELFAVEAKEPSSTLLVLRRSERLAYRARMTDGSFEELARKHPDRTKWFEGEIANAEKELDAAKLRMTTLDVELTAKNETLSERRLRVAERMREEPSLGARTLALWATLVTWILATLRVRSHPRLSPPESKRSPPADGRVVSAMIAQRDIERAMETAEDELGRREKTVARIRAEAKAHADEREGAFVADVRALTDGEQRGAQLDELTLEIPDGLLPEGIAMLDAPPRDLRDRAGACFVVAAQGSLVFADVEEAVRPIVPHVIDANDDEALSPARLRETLPSLFERAREESPLSVLALALADMPARMQALAGVTATGEAEQKARIETLERERLPEPGKFQEEQLARMAGAIEEGARRVLKKATARLRERTQEMQEEWIAAIEACTDRASLATTVARLDASAPERLNRLLDGVGDDIGAEIQATSELLQVWVLDEVRQRYKTHYLHADKTALVVAELPSAEIATLGATTLAPVLRRFATARLALTLAPIAGGAAVGGAIHTATGAAIGAAAGLVAGMIASFVPRVQSMKTALVAAVRTRVAEVEKAMAAWLEGSYGNFARDIRAAVDDTLVDALERRDQSIQRLIELEGETIERERKKLAALSELKTALDDHAARFARLAETSAAALKEITARR